MKFKAWQPQRQPSSPIRVFTNSQQDLETSGLHLVHRTLLPLAYILHEALSAWAHHAPQRTLPLLPHVNEPAEAI